MMDLLLEWVISASALILVVLILRRLLGKRISAGLRYGLWAIVLMRLLVPVPLFSLSVMALKLPDWTPPESFQEESIYVLPISSIPVEESGISMWADGTIMEVNSFGCSRIEDGGTRVVRYADKITPLELLGWIWIAGAAVMGTALVVFNVYFSRRLRRVRRLLEGTNGPVPVYVAPALPSPCLVGLFRAAVYVTEEAAEDPVMLRHVMAHELTHYNHLDHLWSVLRGAALAIHWWNPLVWLSVVCSRRDGELACDGGALKRLGDGERTAYGETLLALVTAKARPADLLSFATTMSGGKRSLKERIQRIAHQPRQLAGAMAAVLIVLSLSALVAFGQAKEPETDVSAKHEPPAASANRPVNAWQTAHITVDENGTPHIDYAYGNTMEFLDGNPIPAPREWADEDLAGRNEAATLQFSPDIWAQLVSETDGWLVACYERGVAAADTYVYKTEDGGMNWTEVTMPGTNWHIADVGFLSPDRLIVAQRLFNDAPCFITKDGGESWEEIELPDTQVLSIHFDGNTVVMDIGAHEGEPATCTMLSSDKGDNWMTSSPGPQWTRLVDLDHDGLPDMLNLWHTADESIETWILQFTASYMSSPTWEGEALSPHVGWTSFFLCRIEGEDYLLQYTPYMGGGVCQYSYKLFYLTTGGQEVVVQENSVDFDVIFSPDYAEQHQYDPWAINAFMEEINALLANSEQLINTDENLLGTFQQEGRLYDSVWWLDDDQDEALSLLENLILYQDKAQEASGSQTAAITADLDRDGAAETLDVSSSGEVPVYTLRAVQNGEVIWSDSLDESHGGCNTYFLCRKNALDYLLEYMPKMQQGVCTYSYRLFHLEGGREVTDQENSIEFDLNFSAQYHQFDPSAISAFMQEVNELIGSSQLLLNTNHWMLNLEEDGSSRLRDNVLVSLHYKEDQNYRTEADLCTALEAFSSYAQDHPDDAWSPLADLLLDLTEEDIVMFNGDTSELVRLLRGAERGSRFYTWESEVDAYKGAGAEEVDYTIWNVSLADGSTLCLYACEDRASVLMIYETPEEVISAFYNASELREWILDADRRPN